MHQIKKSVLPVCGAPGPPLLDSNAGKVVNRHRFWYSSAAFTYWHRGAQSVASAGVADHAGRKRPKRR